MDYDAKRMKKVAKFFYGLWHFLLKFLKRLTIVSGMVFLLMIVLSFTDYPYDIYHWLGTSRSEITVVPDYIVVMGAGGMPGPGGLMRSFYARKAALAFPEAQIIIALPTGRHALPGSDAWKMYKQISREQLHPGRFRFETRGTNTHSQACRIREMHGLSPDSRLLIVTSPEHMYRCILTFEKCGFRQVNGLPTFSAGFDSRLLLSDDKAKKCTPPSDRNIDIRYNMWSYLKLQISLLREGAALVWYRLNGYL